MGKIFSLLVVSREKKMPNRSSPPPNRSFRYRPFFEILESRETPTAGTWGFGSTGADQGRAIVADASGNVIVAGSFQGTVDFDPGPGVTSRTSAGVDDIFVAKFTAAGTLLWARSLGGTGSDHGFSIALDASNNVYVTGDFSATAAFSTFNLTSAGGTDIFVTKLDSTGNLLWADRLGGPLNDDSPNSGVWYGKSLITVDSAGNVYTTGNFQGTASFGTFNLTSAGSKDIFVTKLNSAGSFVWAKALGGTFDDDHDGAGIAVDGSGNLYITGCIWGTANFGSTLLTSAGGTDIFVSKLDNNGNVLWAKSMGGTGAEEGYGIALDSSGNVYTTGGFRSNPGDFDPGPGTFNLSVAGLDSFVSKLDNNGNFVWAKQLGGLSDQAYGVVVDGSGNVFTIGQFSGTQDFDPGSGTFNLTSAGGVDGFVSVLNSAGNFVYAADLGGGASDISFAIAVQGSNIWTTGYFSTTADFDPGPFTRNLTSAGSTDVFVSRLAPGVTVNESSGSTSLAEGGATDTYGVVLDYPPTSNVTIQVGPDSQVTISPASLVFTPSNWNTAQTVTVTAVDDTLIEGDHTGTITHLVNSADTRYNSISSPSVTAAILDNDPNRLLPAPGFPRTLNGDYVAAGVGLNNLTAGNITIAGIPAGSTPVAANLYWGFYTTSQTPALAALSLNGTALTGTLIGSQPNNLGGLPPMTYTYRADVTSLVSGNGLYALSGVATGGQIQAQGASLVIVYANPLLPSKTILLYEGDNALDNIRTTVANTFTGFTAPARFSARTTFIVGQGETGISDNGSFTGSLGSTPLTNYFNGTNGRNWDTNTINISSLIAPGDTSVSGQFVFNADRVQWVAQVLAIGPPGVIFTQTGGSTDVVEGGGSDTYFVVLTDQPAANVTITPVAADPTQVAVVPATLTFTPANWNVPQTVTVTAPHDLVAQPSPHAILVNHSATSTDAAYNGLTLASVPVNITDIDVPGVTITPTSLNATVAGVAVPYTVVLNSKPNASVTITPIPDGQETVAPAALTFTPANWNVPQTVQVTPAGLSGPGPFTGLIKHTLATSDTTGYKTLSVSSVTVNIAQAPGVIVTPSGGSTAVIAASPITDTYTINLTTPPSAEVTITLAPGPRLALSPATLVFTSTNWNVPQVVTVSGVTPGSDTISHTAASSDTSYNSIAIASIPVTILDKTGFIINGTSGNDTVIVTPSADLSQVLVAVNGQLTFVPATVTQLVINVGNGNDTIRLNNPILPVFVDAGLGTDYLIINGQAAGNTFVLDNLTLTANSRPISLFGLENLTANGFAGNDAFAVQGDPDSSLKYVLFNGGLGTDTLTGPDANNSWKITGSNTGLLNGVTRFAGIENLTGGPGADTFTFSPGKNITGRINGAGGNDILDDSLWTTPLTFNLQTGSATATGGLQNIETILAGKSANDKLIGPDVTSVWNVTGKNEGNVAGVAFRNIENLTGGSGNDSFILADAASLTGKFDGGPGTSDSLNYVSFTTPVNVNLQLKKTTAAGGFANIEMFLAPSTSANTLTAANKVNTWTIASANAGTLFDGTTTFTFTAFANLVGGASSDTFTSTASWTGSLNGGLGTDTLTAGSGSHAWNVIGFNAGTLDGHSFSAIENLKGGSGTDTFTLQPGTALTGKIDGSTGSNTLDYSAFTMAVSINLALGQASGTGGILNLGRFLAGASTNNSIIAANLANAWNLTATNAGSFTNSSGTFTFTDFQNLTGGSMDDIFTLAVTEGWTGFLQGSLGNDTLTAFGTGNTWTASTLNGRKFGSIEITG